MHLGALSLALVVFALPLAAEAQQAGKVYRIGILSPGLSPSEGERQRSPLLAALRELGYEEGKNLIIERRYAKGNVDRLPPLAQELVRLKIEVLVVPTAETAARIREFASNVPTVVLGGGDLVAAGLVASLAKPGGNVTGLQLMQTDLPPKRLELLKEAVPNLSRVGVLVPPAGPAHAIIDETLQAMEMAARALAIQPHILRVGSADEFSGMFLGIGKQHIDALLVMGSFFTFMHRRTIADLAIKSQLPTMHELREFVEAGGLMSYGPSLAEATRRGATYVDKILKGAKPGDLPVEQPTKFELAINLKTAKALGLTIPASLLLRADQVIE